MKIAYFDTIAGIAGDMTMAALVSAGVPIDHLRAELRKLPLQGFEVQTRHVQRSAITAIHLEVVVSQDHPHHRHLKDILAIIDSSALAERVKERARAIFGVIADAEAKVHHTTIERVHFHEVGATDSIADIVGTAICLEYFSVERVYTSPIKLGSGGTIHTQHGIMPTPAPATVEILTDYPTILTSVPHELTTPTGAGIVKALSYGILSDEVLVPHTVGYGAGTREFPEIPNLLRVIVGELSTEMQRDEVVIVETNIDDMNPQVYPYLIEKLLASGAHDAYLIPIVMKKGRPGHLLSVMVDKSRLEEILDVVYRQTSTIGVRILPIGRRKLPRRNVEVETSFGMVRAKAVLRDGKEILSPEFEECKRIAEEKHIPLLEVMQRLSQELAGR